MKKLIILLLVVMLSGCTQDVEWKTCSMGKTLYVDGREYSLNDPYNDFMYREIDNTLYIVVHPGEQHETEYVIHGDYTFVCKK